MFQVVRAKKMSKIAPLPHHLTRRSFAPLLSRFEAFLTVDAILNSEQVHFKQTCSHVHHPRSVFSPLVFLVFGLHLRHVACLLAQKTSLSLNSSSKLIQKTTKKSHTHAPKRKEKQLRPSPAYSIFSSCRHPVAIGAIS